jgi:hypothetical protein
MTTAYYDRIQETTTTTGTGTIILDGAVSSFQSFAVVGSGNQTYYCINDDNNWEIGSGTYTLNTVANVQVPLLTRTVISSSNNNALVNFGAGIKNVSQVVPAQFLNSLSVGGNSGFSSGTIIRASDFGVPNDGSFTNPSAGTDATTIIQNILNLAQNGPLIYIHDVLCKAHDLKIYSNTIVQGLGGSYEGIGNWPKTGLILSPTNSPSTTQCLLRNANWRSPATAVDGSGYATASIGTNTKPDFSRIIDHDITIRDLFIFGNSGIAAGQAAAGGTDRRFNTNGFWQSPYMFFGVQNLTLENLFIYDTPTFAYFASYISHLSAKNLTTVDPTFINGVTSGRNTDGFHLVGPCECVNLDGLDGWAGDDFIALNASDGNILIGNGGASSQGPSVWGSHLNVYKGPILNVTIRGVNLKKGLSVLRLLSDNTLIDGIVIQGVNALCTLYVMTATTLGTLSPGNIGRVELTDWNVDTIPGSSNPFQISLNAINLKINGLRMLGSGSMQQIPVIAVSGGSSETIVLDTCYINNYSNVITLSGSASLQNLIISNSQHPIHGDISINNSSSNPVAVLTGAGNINLTTIGNFSNLSQFFSTYSPPLLDNFVGPSGAISAHTSDSGHTWIDPVTTTNQSHMVLDGNNTATIFDPNTTRGGSAISSWAPSSANYSVQATCQITTNLPTEIGVILRATNVPGQFLCGYVGHMSGYYQQYQICKLWSGNAFQIVASTPHTFIAGEQHVLKLSVSGNTLTLYVDGVSTLTYVDTSSPLSAAGQAGLRLACAASTTTTGGHVLQITTSVP